MAQARDEVPCLILTKSLLLVPSIGQVSPGSEVRSWLTPQQWCKRAIFRGKEFGRRRSGALQLQALEGHASSCPKLPGWRRASEGFDPANQAPLAFEAKSNPSDPGYNENARRVNQRALIFQIISRYGFVVVVVVVVSFFSITLTGFVSTTFRTIMRSPCLA